MSKKKICFALADLQQIFQEVFVVGNVYFLKLKLAIRIHSRVEFRIVQRFNCFG